jgi:hypothetical protein
MEERSKVNGTIKRRRRLERPDMVAALQASSHFKSSEEGGKVSLTRRENQERLWDLRNGTGWQSTGTNVGNPAAKAR